MNKGQQKLSHDKWSHWLWIISCKYVRYVKIIIHMLSFFRLTKSFVLYFCSELPNYKKILDTYQFYKYTQEFGEFICEISVKTISEANKWFVKCQDNIRNILCPLYFRWRVVLLELWQIWYITAIFCRFVLRSHEPHWKWEKWNRGKYISWPYSLEIYCVLLSNAFDKWIGL